MDRVDAALVRGALVEAGHGGLNNDRTILVLWWFAAELRTSTLDSFDDVNDRIGTANGLASGIVRRTMGDLADLGYLAIESSGAVRLTARGADAAQVMLAALAAASEQR